MEFLVLSWRMGGEGVRGVSRRHIRHCFFRFVPYSHSIWCSVMSGTVLCDERTYIAYGATATTCSACPPGQLPKLSRYAIPGTDLA
eukprot:3719793-Rhodomonas_salina.3